MQITSYGQLNRSLQTKKGQSGQSKPHNLSLPTERTSTPTFSYRFSSSGKVPAHFVRFGADNMTDKTGDSKDGTELPKFTRRVSPHLQTMLQYLIPKPLEKMWPAIFLAELTKCEEIRKYLDTQGISSDDVYKGLQEELIGKKYKHADRIPMEYSLLDQIATEIRQFAKKEGEEKVVPETAWRWLMRIESKTIDSLFQEAGFDKSMIERLRKAPAPVRNSSKTNASGPPSYEEVVAMEKALEEVPKQIIGQDNAVATLLNGFQRAKMGYTDEKKPHQPKVRIIMLGPSGVGKTETAKVLAKVLGRPLIVQPMNQFKEQHRVSEFLGAPPGYSGFGESNSFIDRIIKAREDHEKNGTPLPIVLFDEIEKAHTTIFDPLMHILDEGMVKSTKGEEVSFQGIDIVMTSNIAQKKIIEEKKRLIEEGFTAAELDDKLDKIVRKELEEFTDPETPGGGPKFRPEFINRMSDVVVYETLDRRDVGRILDLNLKSVTDQVKKEDKMTLEVSDDLREYILTEGYNEKYGGREVVKKMHNILGVALTKNRAEMVKKPVTHP